MPTDKEPSQAIFFLGAGASVVAGVPDTYSFVKEFIEDIEDPAKKRTIERIVQILKGGKKQVDIELLLEILTKLGNKEQEPLLRFYEGGNFILEGYYEKKPLIDDLKDFIKSKAIVSEKKIQYLQPFNGFVEEFRPLDIISVNYDICIEQFCNVHKLVYQDGFDVRWNPKTFDAKDTDIRLYKLHGSAMWYQSDNGGYIKLPVMSEASKIRLITGEKAENLMLYPMQKWDYAEPLLELMVETKHLLESEKCKFLIVVGYSFRDEHIKRIIWDVARKKKEFHLILIDPKAYQIYSEKLKYYDEAYTIPSSLDGRVVCLPYKFEGVFPYLKNYYLRNLREALTDESTQQRAEIKGEKANWLSPIRPFVKAEHPEKIVSLFRKIDNFDPTREWELHLELSLKTGLNLLFNNQNEHALRFLKAFDTSLYAGTVERLSAEVMRSPLLTVEVAFNYQRSERSSSHIGAEQFKKTIESLSEFCETRIKFAESKNKQAQRINKKLKKLKHYLDQFQDGKIKFEDYIRLRKPAPPFEELCKGFLQTNDLAIHGNLVELAVQ